MADDKLSKAEASRGLNALLCLSEREQVDFTKLSKEEMRRIFTALNDIGGYVKRRAKGGAKGIIRGFAQDVVDILDGKS